MSAQHAGDVALEFTLARERFALPVDSVQEITEVSYLQRVPKAPAAIAGLLDVRGRVVTLVDLATVFGLSAEEEASAEAPVAMILAPPDSHIGLLVRGRPKVTRLNLPASEAREGLIDRVLMEQDRLYNIINPRRILAFCEKQVFDVFRLTGTVAISSPPAASGRQA
jgi:chemotaxis signal transduction protein